MEDKDLDPDELSSKENDLLETWGPKVFDLVMAFNRIDNFYEQDLICKLANNMADSNEIIRRLANETRGE